MFGGKSGGCISIKTSGIVNVQRTGGIFANGGPSGSDSEENIKFKDIEGIDNEISSSSSFPSSSPSSFVDARGGGGGSGGSIVITAGLGVNGTGTIAALGGDSVSELSGAGGGGRIVITVSSILMLVYSFVMHCNFMSVVSLAVRLDLLGMHMMHLCRQVLCQINCSFPPLVEMPLVANSH